ncbi:inward rectifier potassium channel 18-like [Diorhabda sublineata]|uniref:inward rectifier potassium channel 18-like n=1 Tax=Diorhabda sublineata TaxID=1163346 RepID=UPI0024E13BED|nr:inward rectifier potassium channel 18-like [Diorhabda sublineata]
MNPDTIIIERGNENKKRKFDSEVQIPMKTVKQRPRKQYLLVENNDDNKRSNYSVRAVSKTGECNIFPSNVEKKKFLRDFFTTLIDMKWRYTLAIVSLGFIITWTLFAIIWWLIAIYHGDLEENHLPMHQAASNWTPCVTDIHDFTSCFLFSVETQQTTGYGEKRPTEKCIDAVILMCIQNVVGLIVDAFLVGVFFAKLTRPKHRTQTIQFSKCAVISMRDNKLCLMIRLGDMRERSRIIEAKVKVQMVKQKVSKEGEYFSNYLMKLPTNIDDCENDLLFIWPMTVVHVINSSSPLYNISKNDLHKRHFEIIISLEGTIESTDQKTQARSSYLADEIIWGYRFASMISICTKRNGYKIDYTKFDETIESSTPNQSAAELDLLKSGCSSGIKHLMREVQ